MCIRDRGYAGGDSTAGADIRLLSARKLIAHIDGGGKMEIRQALEAAGTDVFLDAATVRGLLPELETKDKYRCTFSGVVALSYAWVTPADPDPQRAQLLQLRPVLVWWMCERARRKRGYDGGVRKLEPDATIQTADFGVFIDFMSMHQKDDYSDPANPAYTKPAEQASFGRALRNIGLLYGHAGSVVFKMTKTPLPADGDPDRVYDRRGWCHLERRLGDLEAPATNSLDVSAWPTAEAERAARKLVRGGATAAQRGPPQLRESEEELAAQGDHKSTGSPSTLDALIRDGGRGDDDATEPHRHRRCWAAAPAARLVRNLCALLNPLVVCTAGISAGCPVTQIAMVLAPLAWARRAAHQSHCLPGSPLPLYLARRAALITNAAPGSDQLLAVTH